MPCGPPGDPALRRAQGHSPEPTAPTFPDPHGLQPRGFPRRPGGEQTRDRPQPHAPPPPRGRFPPLARAGHSCGVTEGHSKASQPRLPPERPFPHLVPFCSKHRGRKACRRRLPRLGARLSGRGISASFAAAGACITTRVCMVHRSSSLPRARDLERHQASSRGRSPVLHPKNLPGEAAGPSTLLPHS